MPAHAPFYPELPATYRDVRIARVPFRADPAAVACFLPPGLEPDPEGACAAVGIEVPFCTAYGPFGEGAIWLRARFRGETGWYLPIIWHDGPAGIAAGREIYGAPKVFSRIVTGFDGPTWRTEVTMGGLPVFTIAMTLDAPMDPSDVPAYAPDWRLKVIPRADGPGAAIHQLIDASGAGSDGVVSAAFRGRGTVTFGASPLCDLTALGTHHAGEAFWTDSSFREGYGRVVHDFLAETGAAGEGAGA
jgi:acetoacetate decarboxylase